MNSRRMTACAAVAALGMLAFSLTQGLGAGPSGTAGRTAASKPASRPATSPATATAPAGVLLDWQRTGGFAGTNDTLTVQAGGAYKTTGKLVGAREGRLDAATLDGLTKAIQAAKITKDAEYQPNARVADVFWYTLHVDGHTVKWFDGAKVSAEIEALAKEINDVLTKVRDAKDSK